MKNPILTLSLSLLLLASCAGDPKPNPSSESSKDPEIVATSTLSEEGVSEDSSESTPDSKESDPEVEITSSAEGPAPERNDYGYSARYTDFNGYSEKVQKMMRMSSHVLKSGSNSQTPKQRRNAIVASNDNVLGFDIGSFEAKKSGEQPLANGEFIVASNIFNLQNQLLAVSDIADANQYVHDELSNLYTGFYLNGDEMAYYQLFNDDSGSISSLTYFYVQENENGVFYYGLAYSDFWKIVNIAVPGQYLYVGTPTGQMYYDCTEKFMQDGRHFVNTFQIENGNPENSIETIGQITKDRCAQIIASQTKSEVTYSEFLERTSSPFTSDLIDDNTVYYVTAAYQDPITSVTDVSKTFSDFGLDFEDPWTSDTPKARELYHITSSERDAYLYSSSFRTLKPLETADDYIQNAKIQVSPEVTLTFTNYRVDPNLCLDYMGYMKIVDNLIDACEVTEENRAIVLDICRYFARPYDDIKANPETDLGSRIDSLTLVESCLNGDELKSLVKDFISFIIAGTPQI